MMTVKSDIQKVLASCEEIKGSYAAMAHSTEDKMAKQMYDNMKADIERHIMFLSDRLEFVNHQSNQKTD